MSELHRVTSEIQFDFGHRIPDHKSKCSSVHGHRARVKVTVEGPLHVQGSDSGMVIDFGDLKQTMMREIHDRFDHRFLMYERDPMFEVLMCGTRVDPLLKATMRDCGIGALYQVKDFGYVQMLTVIPTSENLAWVCFKLLSCITLPAVLVKVKFWETPNSMAEYSAQKDSTLTREC